MNTTNLLLIPFAFSAVVMLILWAIQLKTRNAGTVDVAWSFLTPTVGVWLIYFDDVPNDLRQLLIAFMALFWGFRLGTYLFKRVMSETEDGRYRFMRNYCGDKADLAFFIFFLVQASWTVLFALPFWAASRNSSPDLNLLDGLGVLVWLLAMLGEAVSDKQLNDFRSLSENKGKVCNVGLWRYSRHPNYFFEWLQWWAFIFIGYGSDNWWLCWSGLIVVYVFITRITGVPYTEDQSIRSRGDAYRQYQKTTSMFFPLPPRSNA